MKILLISTYELGRQPFGLASPAAWLRGGGHSVVSLDLTRETLEDEQILAAELICFYVPMHTATRLAAGLIPRVRKINPQAHLCFYGLYAPVNEEYLRGLGVGTILGGEFEEGLMSLAQRSQQGAANGNSPGAQAEPVISLARQKFLVPDRAGMLDPAKYARVVMPSGEHRVAGSTEATRGCKHLCRHCPIVPVYNGAFRVVEREIVLEDIRRQVAAGARHITFGDPDFFNGPTHSISIVRAMHRDFPELSYDVTIKVEHLRLHDALLPVLRDTGCLFVTSAVESVDDAVLEKFDKGHTRADFLAVIARFRELSMTLIPTFVPFTPWTTFSGYLDLLDVLSTVGLTENVPPIQLAIRLLIPAGSRLLELAEVKAIIDPFDSSALVFPWTHADARMDALAREISQIVQRGDGLKLSRTEIFSHIRRAAQAASGNRTPVVGAASLAVKSAPVPYLDEPWYCCAEPMDAQFVSIGKPKEAVAKADQYV
ncbi:MAG TPA: CUAEP/CCAEP-tail radical SAM protein [Candidatus Acidoferrales bacterium]|nr:CUAEP/CCAEP-tail radical SAM protein [Candidatus Acidoferrales bacterium]